MRYRSDQLRGAHRHTHRNPLIWLRPVTVRATVSVDGAHTHREPGITEPVDLRCFRRPQPRNFPVFSRSIGGMNLTLVAVRAV